MKTFTTLEKEGKEGYKGRKLQHMHVLLLFCIRIFRISNSWLCLQKPVGKSLTCFRCLVNDSVGKGDLLLKTLRSEKKRAWNLSLLPLPFVFYPTSCSLSTSWSYKRTTALNIILIYRESVFFFPGILKSMQDVILFCAGYCSLWNNIL